MLIISLRRSCLSSSIRFHSSVIAHFKLPRVSHLCLVLVLCTRPIPLQNIPHGAKADSDLVSSSSESTVLLVQARLEDFLFLVLGNSSPAISTNMLGNIIATLELQKLIRNEIPEGSGAYLDFLEQLIASHNPTTYLLQLNIWPLFDVSLNFTFQGCSESLIHFDKSNIQNSILTCSADVRRTFCRFSDL